MTPRTGTRGAAALALVVGLAVGVLTACQPPAPDGRDLGITLDRTSLSLQPGTSATIVAVTAENHGTTVASTASVIVAVPTLVQATASVTGGQSCSSQPIDADQSILVCPLSSLAPGGTRTVSVSLTSAGPGGFADVTVGVVSDSTELTTDPHPNQRVLPVMVEAPGEVDLTVFLFPDEQPFIGGGPAFVSTAFVANDEAGSPSEVTVTQRFPSSVTADAATFRRFDGRASGTCTITTGLVSCRTGSATVGSSASGDQFWEMAVHLDPGSDEDLPIEVEVTSPQAEPVPDDVNPNAILVTHRSPSSASLSFWPVDRARPGFPVAVRASGLDPFEADEVTLTVPPGFELESVEGSRLGCVGTGTVVCPLSVGNLVPVRFYLRVLAPSPPVPLAYSFTSATEEVAAGAVYLWAG